MNTKRNQHVERYTRRFTAKVMHVCLHIAFFFAIAALLSLFLFNDFLLDHVAKPEYAAWLTVETQSKLKFVFRCISELFYILGLSSLSVGLYFMASYYLSQGIKRIKNKFAKAPNEFNQGQ
ncbi:hypothetical protein ROW55_021200 [Providencia rettgeri]|uniref:hypothetical protein n=1 Tax=Providencia rettgeri TaxID=587 RepID=UPI001B376CDC|nr:hypothetical protein [Providencia rettgeri]MBQ0211398.1 hypothetical protein [Providencia rettgeri]MDH2379497.1 hypothetical protein [Providencia rettgeri]MDR9617004.1 hypothetical protein [Providencia rettgeri]MDW7803724.1 hypothetical protein [Providencia rettgeri]